MLRILVLPLMLACCSSEPPATPAPTQPSAPAVAPPAGQPGAVCDTNLAGPAAAPAGAVVVEAGVDSDLANKTDSSPAGTTFWLTPGKHTLGSGEFGQVTPKDGNTYLGGPGAIIDGRGQNRFAFTQHARNVTIRNLTIQGFVPPQDQGVVNHDSGDGWVIENNTIQENRGAGTMAGAHQQLRHNCLRNNGQYGMNAFKDGDSIVGLVVEGNEIVGNNTDDLEKKSPGCGCTGGVKFWAVNGADIRSNWVHDNHGAGLWADTNNNDFLIENNLIENNDGEAIFYEISYNLVIRGNTIRKNALVGGKEFASKDDNFPVAAIYLSESGGEPRVPARTDKIEIDHNVLENNWSGITAWENSDRFCNSPANTSGGYCTLLATTAACSQPGVASKPLYDDCRWRTQRLDIHDNTFTFETGVVGCPDGKLGRMAMLANFGTFPDWSPYKGTVVQDAITFKQGNTWRNNSYRGPWRFTTSDVGHTVGPAEWQAAPYTQDVGSTFADAGGC